MARDAALFRVQGPHGIYYAVYDAKEQLLFTQANEKAARDHATEIGLVVSRERIIRHAELMRLTGRDAAPSIKSTDATPAKPSAPEVPQLKPLEARLPRDSGTATDNIVSTRVLATENPFASAEPLQAASSDDELDALPPIEITPSEITPSEALNRDVLEMTRAPRIGRHGNPFADRPKK